MKWVNECAPMLVPLRACRDKPSPASGVNVPLARRLKMTSPALALRQDPSALHMQRDSSCAGSWGYQWCTEMTQPFTQGTDRDFFFCPNGTFYVKRNCSQWVCASLAEPCLNACPHPACAHAERRQTRMCTVLERQPEVRVRCLRFVRLCVFYQPQSPIARSVRPEWARVGLGGKRIAGATNIVFSNGAQVGSALLCRAVPTMLFRAQDPWHGGGVLRNLSHSVLAILIPNGAHHIDLMFSDPVPLVT